MKIFESSQKKYNELEAIIIGLGKKIKELEKEIQEKPSDLEKEAKQASKKTTEYRNKVLLKFKESEKLINEISKTKISIDEKFDDISTNHTSAISSTEELLTAGKRLSEILNSTKDFLENHPNIENEIEEIEDLHSKIEETSSKVNTTHRGIISKKSEIDELHREIIGYEEEDEDGELIEIEGLKSKLEKSYDKLSKSSKQLNNDIEELSLESQKKYDNFVNENQEDLNNIKSDFKNEYDKINSIIKSLLPSALTAGLSSAFINKKTEEETLYKEYKTNFKNGIRNLTISALLPIGISVTYLLMGATLIDTIERAPKIMLAFLPLYIPLVWVTISANKKVNLSKRLIEEYSHKQVLSMTIEGLSNQIENIEDSEISEELRIQLLTNFLKVADENPGKLISNYQESDNPLLNLFDRKKKDKTIVKEIIDETKNIIGQNNE
ncbi:hypothetical protein [Tenacibaculum ovolyticum]|uniref:hypothetical protein n=1 Tax=Tenacibaculum ovolyticum TaxID=104270 RepID=UPI003BA8FB66